MKVCLIIIFILMILSLICATITENLKNRNSKIESIYLISTIICVSSLFVIYLLICSMLLKTSNTKEVFVTDIIENAKNKIGKD